MLMGTASLVIGLGLIILGFFLIIQTFVSPSTVEYEYVLFATLIVSAPLIAVGGLLLRKYDRDKKKSENS